jgi:hypothetical protein
MNTRNLPGGKGRPTRKADKLTAICKLIVWKMCEPRRLTTLLASTACHRDSFTFFFTTFRELDLFPSSDLWKEIFLFSLPRWKELDSITGHQISTEYETSFGIETMSVGQTHLSWKLSILSPDDGSRSMVLNVFEEYVTMYSVRNNGHFLQ